MLWAWKLNYRTLKKGDFQVRFGTSFSRGPPFSGEVTAVCSSGGGVRCPVFCLFLFLHTWVYHHSPSFTPKGIFAKRVIGLYGSPSVRLPTDFTGHHFSFLDVHPLGWSTLEIFLVTHPKTNSLALKIDPWKRRVLLETIIFRGYVSFREDIHYYN